MTSCRWDPETGNAAVSRDDAQREMAGGAAFWTRTLRGPYAAHVVVIDYQRSGAGGRLPASPLSASCASPTRTGSLRTMRLTRLASFGGVARGLEPGTAITGMPRIAASVTCFCRSGKIGEKRGNDARVWPSAVLFLLGLIWPVGFDRTIKINEELRAGADA